MGGVTTSGYPYVTPTDHPKEFPAHSQALANKLEAGATWTAYVPTLTNCTAQTIVAEYIKVGRMVTVLIKLTIATMGTGPQISLPFPADTAANASGVGTARMTPAGLFWGVVGTGATTFTVACSGTNGASVAITPTVPATWAAGSTISFVATYKSST